MNKIKNQIFNKYRNYLIGVITDNMGKVEETENNFICYVDNKIFQDKNYVIISNMDNLTERRPFSVIEEYNLNKPIIYVFDGIDLNCSIKFNVYDNNCIIIIKNSSFSGFNILNFLGDCYLSNVKINSNKDILNVGCSSKKIYINNLIINELENGFISFNASEEMKINKLNAFGSKKFSLTCPEKIDISSSTINSKKLIIKSNVINFEQNMYENQGKNLNDTNIDMLIKENKKLSKVKSR